MKLPGKVCKGEPITADWGNDVVNKLRSLQPCPSPDIGFNQTANGWTAFLKEDIRAFARQPKLWKLSFTKNASPTFVATKVFESILSEMTKNLVDSSNFTNLFFSVLSQIIGSFENSDFSESKTIQRSVVALLQPIYTTIASVDKRVAEVLNSIASVQSELELFFNSKKVYPRNGDMIYTNELGICYTIFKEVIDSDEKYPTSNLIFRVPFVIGKDDNGDGGITFYALSMYPAPDFAEIIKTFLNGFVDFVGNFIGGVMQGMVNAVLKAVGSAQHQLYEFIKELLIRLEAELKALIDGLRDAIGDLDELLDGILDPEKGSLQALQNQIASIKKVSVSLLGSDGFVHSIQALADEKGADCRVDTSWIDKDGNVLSGKIPIWNYLSGTSQVLKEITWIDSKDGTGHKAKTFLFDEESPHIDKVNWEALDYINSDGKSCEVDVLMHSAKKPTETDKIAPIDVKVCEDGVTKTKTFVAKKDKQ